MMILVKWQGVMDTAGTLTLEVQDQAVREDQQVRLIRQFQPLVSECM